MMRNYVPLKKNKNWVFSLIDDDGYSFPQHYIVDQALCFLHVVYTNEPSSK